MIRLSQQQFNWSTIPQLYPLEKAPNGKDLYAKYVVSTAANASSTFAHGVTDLPKKLVRAWGSLHHNSPITDMRPLPYVEESGNAGNSIRLYIDSTNISCYANSAGSYATCRFTVYLLYTLENLDHFA